MEAVRAKKYKSKINILQMFQQRFQNSHAYAQMNFMNTTI